MKVTTFLPTISEILGKEYSDFTYFCIIDLNKEYVHDLLYSDYLRYQSTRKCSNEYILSIINKLDDKANLRVAKAEMVVSQLKEPSEVKQKVQNKVTNHNKRKSLNDLDVLNNHKKIETKRRNTEIRDDLLCKLVDNYPHLYDFVIAAEEMSKKHTKNIEQYVKDTIDGDKNAKVLLIEACTSELLKTAYICSKKYCINFDDAFSDGIIAVMEGMERFNPSVHPDFISFACKRAKAAIVTNNVAERIKIEYEESFWYSVDILVEGWEDILEERRHSDYYNKDLSKLTPLEHNNILENNGVYDKRYTPDGICKDFVATKEVNRHILIQSKNKNRHKKSKKNIATDNTILNSSGKKSFSPKYASNNDKNAFFEYLCTLYSTYVANDIINSVRNIENKMLDEKMIDHCFMNRKDVEYLNYVEKILRTEQSKNYVPNLASFYSWLQLWNHFWDS